MSLNSSEINNSELEKEKSFFSIVVHSFFIIPFLIVVFGALLFAAIHLLTNEKRTAFDYLEDVKVGGITRRWQAAFELSKILSNPKSIPNDERFINEMINAFEKSEHDDPRIRQYLALAMGRAGKVEFVAPILRALNKDKEENISALIYAIGMFRQPQTAKVLIPFASHADPRIRSIATVALGNIANPETVNILKKGLNDVEANVQWGSAISLAQMNDDSGKEILAKLLSREYLAKFSEVDQQEQTEILLNTISASGKLKNLELNEVLKSLAKDDKNMRVRAAALAQVTK